MREVGDEAVVEAAVGGVLDGLVEAWVQMPIEPQPRLNCRR